MTSEQLVRNVYKNAMVGWVAGSCHTYRIYKNDRCRFPDRLGEATDPDERKALAMAWDRAAIIAQAYRMARLAARREARIEARRGSKP